MSFGGGHHRAQSADLAGVGVPGWQARGAGSEAGALRLDGRSPAPQAKSTAKTPATAARRRSHNKTTASQPLEPTFKIPEPVPVSRRHTDKEAAQVEDPRANLTEVQLTKNFLQREIEARRSHKTPLFTCDENPDEQPVRKLFIVSARLPFTVWFCETNTDEHRFEIRTDPFDMNIVDLLGSGPRHADPVLIGTPVVRKEGGGQLVMTESLQAELDEYLRDHPVHKNLVPVFPPPNRDRFADWMIFPLFHYSLPSAETGLGVSDWEGYQIVNEKFRDVVLKEYKKERGDLVWINDYPLMLLPKLLRKEKPDIPIGFYLHCVFPSSEVYRILPQREEILRGVLSSNIVGFHNFEYQQQFINSCIHILGLECTATGIEACEDAGGTTTKVVTVPLGINTEPYIEQLKEERTISRIAELEETFKGKKLLVAMDLLEEKKGIPHKIMAFHKLLQKDEERATNCVFLQIVHSTEETAPEQDATQQQRLLQQVYQMVGEVNSKFGTIGHVPLHFLWQDFNRADLVALLRKAHVMIDTPLRDVVSVSAHEFLCCQDEKDCGVLVLSEFSGSAQSLRAAALTVNPWDTNAFAEALQDALDMNFEERLELHRYGNKHVSNYTLKTWATNFRDELQRAELDCQAERLDIPPQLDHQKPIMALRQANRRMIILGFSGTLVPHRSRPHSKIMPRLPPTLSQNLQVLAEDPNTVVIIISGLAKGTLEQTVGHIPCWLIAEGGLCWREPTNSEWRSVIEPRDTEWLGPVKDIMEYFTARTPGSNVLEMTSSVSWLYQRNQGDHAAIQSKDLLVHLWAGPLLSAPAEVVVEQDSVTVRPTGTGKATQLEKLLNQICCEDSKEKVNTWLRGDTMVMCVGDFLVRDEDIFATVSRFFEADAPVERRGSSYSMDSTSSKVKGGGDLWGEPQSLAERAESFRSEALHLEANSISLGKGFDLAAAERRLSEMEEEGRPFARGTSERGSFEGGPGIMKKVPSEPELQVGERDSRENAMEEERQARESPPKFGVSPLVFTCTVTRKATRAAYCLSDTNDVAFLIAQLARELKQAKMSNMESTGNEGASRTGAVGYQGLDSLFSTV